MKKVFVNDWKEINMDFVYHLFFLAIEKNKQKKQKKRDT